MAPETNMDGHTPTQTEIKTEARSILGNVAVFGFTQDLTNRATLLFAKAMIVENSYNGLSKSALYEMHNLSTTFNLPIIG